MKLLNVGGNNKAIPILAFYNGWEHHLLDIDSKGEPEICCDAVLLKDKKKYKNKYDSVYCSHNLEHYYHHKVYDVLEGFKLVLKPDGFVYIAVPHIMNVFRRLIGFNMDISDTLYEIPAGKITPHDVMFGWQKQIRESGDEFFAHKTAFSPKTLREAVERYFKYVWIIEADLELRCIASNRAITTEEANKIMGTQ